MRHSLVLALALAIGCGEGRRGHAPALAASAPATSASVSTPASLSVATRPAVPLPAPSRGDLLAPLDARSGVLRDSLGRHHLLRGVNYAGRAKWPPFTGWARRSDVDAIQALGVDHVRFLITWHAVEPRDGVFDDRYLAEVATILSWFEAAGLRVIVDMHQDQYALRFGGSGFPEWMILSPDPFPGLKDIMASFPLNYMNPKVIANFEAFYRDPRRRARLARAWTHVVSKLEGCRAIAGYDLLNEPFFAARTPLDFEANVLTPLTNELIAAVRAEDKERVIFFEPQLQSALFTKTGLSRPSDANVVLAPHWYDPGVDARSVLGLKPEYDGDASRTATALDKLVGHGRALASPVWVGEYGVQTHMGGADRYLEDHHRLLDERLLSAATWTIDTATPSTYSCLDTSGQPLPIARSWAHPHPRAVAGTLERTRYETTSRTLEVSWREGRLGPGAPTVIELPLHLYPAKAPIEVSLSDAPGAWTFERDLATGRLYVWADPGESVHALRVKPR